MAQWRAIHKGLSTSARMVTLDEWEQLLFVQMVIHAEDFGLLSGDPLTLKLECCPASSRSLQEIGLALAKMASRDHGLIVWYSEGGRKVVSINEWDEMQPRTLIGRRTKPKYPMIQPTSIILPAISSNFQEIPGSSSPDRDRDKTEIETETETDLQTLVISPDAEKTDPGRDVLEDTPCDTPSDTVSVEDTPSPQAKKKREHLVLAKEAFEFWTECFDVNPKRAKLKDSRLSKLKQSLTDYGFSQTCQAILGYTVDSWTDRRSKMNNYDVSTLLRDAKHIETGLELYDRSSHDLSKKLPIRALVCDISTVREAMEASLFGTALAKFQERCGVPVIGAANMEAGYQRMREHPEVYVGFLVEVLHAATNGNVGVHMDVTRRIADLEEPMQISSDTIHPAVAEFRERLTSDLDNEERQRGQAQQ